MRSIQKWLRSHNRSVCWNLSSKRHPDQPHPAGFSSPPAVTDQSRVNLDARGLQYAVIPVDAGAAAQHRDRSIDHGEPPVTKPEQMRTAESPRRPTTVATLGSGNLPSGSINTYGT
jgi:hypothetical protein